MERKEIQNAIITSARLTIEDHGLLSGWLMLDYGGSGQGFGGHALYLPKDFKNSKGNVNYAGHWIYRVLQIAGVERWEDLKGKTIRAEHGGLGSTISRIGHIVKDDWFSPSEEFELLKS